MDDKLRQTVLLALIFGVVSSESSGENESSHSIGKERTRRALVYPGPVTKLQIEGSYSESALPHCYNQPRNKRYKIRFICTTNPANSVFIPPMRFQYILGVGLPIDLDDYAVAVGHIFKASYLLPTNATDYTNPGVIYTRKKRSMVRWDIYEMLSEVAALQGYGGRSCVLRTICELSDAPLNKKHGLMGELLHTLFTPTTTKEDINHHSDNEYYAAHKLGKEVQGKCRHFFRECTVNFADLFSKVYE